MVENNHARPEIYSDVKQTANIQQNIVRSNEHIVRPDAYHHENKEVHPQHGPIRPNPQRPEVRTDIYTQSPNPPQPVVRPEPQQPHVVNARPVDPYAQYRNQNISNEIKPHPSVQQPYRQYLHSDGQQGTLPSFQHLKEPYHGVNNLPQQYSDVPQQPTDLSSRDEPTDLRMQHKAQTPHPPR